MGADGMGKISIRIPKWYNVRGKLNMMFNEKQARNSCDSDAMRIKSSTPDIIG